MSLNDILTQINDVMYTYVLIIMLAGVGIYFTIRTRGVQFRLLKDGIQSMLEKVEKDENGKKKVSSFQALMISTASRVGIGNIAGIAEVIGIKRGLFSNEAGMGSFAFAFSSLIGNYFYAESNILFIKNNKVVLAGFRITCMIAIFLGAQSDFSLAWNIADITMGFMAIVNIIAIFLLGNVAFKALKHYEQKKKQGQNPVFYEDEIGLTGTVWTRDSKE